MKKTSGIITSLFAIALVLTSCTPDPHSSKRDPEPVTNKAVEKVLELKDGKEVNSTVELDGKSFTVKAIGPVSDSVTGLPEASNGAKKIGVTYDNKISPASGASASVDGLPQELLGVKSGEGTIVVVIPDGATNAYALLSFGKQGAISIDMLDGKPTVIPPASSAVENGNQAAPDSNPQPAATQPTTEGGPKTSGEQSAPDGVQQMAPGNIVPSQAAK